MREIKLPADKGESRCWIPRKVEGRLRRGVSGLEEKKKRRKKKKKEEDEGEGRNRRRREEEKEIRKSFPYGSKIRNKKFRAVRGCGLLVGDSKLKGVVEGERRGGGGGGGGERERENSEINRAPGATR